MGNDLNVTLKVVLSHGNVDSLRTAYQTHGETPVNDWLIEHQGYYKIRLAHFVACRKYLEKKSSTCPNLILISKEMLMKSLHTANVGAIRLVHELKCLDGLLFCVVQFVSHRTAQMLEMCKKYGADLTARDSEGNTLLHELAKSKVWAAYSKEQYAITIQKDYYLWTLEYLLTQGLSLWDKNSDDKTPMDVAAVHLNYGFVAAVSILEDKMLYPNKDEEEYGYFSCTLI